MNDDNRKNGNEKRPIRLRGANAIG
jgi:hypothetical protein